MHRHRIMLIGLSDLGSQVLDLLLRIPGEHTFLVGGRDVEYLRQRINLARFAALQLGLVSEVDSTFVDLWNADQTAETLLRFRPSLIICTASLHRWRIHSHFPPALVKRLSAAQMGPRLPFYFTLVYKLMQAVQATGQVIPVINPMYPDVANSVLTKIGLAPVIGVGDLANNVPAVRTAIAMKLHEPVKDIDVRLIMGRYVSYWMTRTTLTYAPFHLTAFVRGENVTHALDKETLFDVLPTILKRTGGSTGLLMAATSIVVIIKAMMNDVYTITHAPGPNGLPGGYPVKVNAQGVEVVLPPDLSLEAAIQINEDGLRLDGIERIADDGTVYFAEREMAIMKEILGYECHSLPVAEAEERARELQARYVELNNRCR